jgi:histidine triad (HIT) family protein
MRFKEEGDMEQKECIFCKIVEGQIPCFKIYEDERVLAFADINPITRGHTLIIPKEHIENIWEMSEECLAAISKVSKKLAQAVKKALNPVGIAFLQLNGKGAGQVIMHYHMHLIPRGPDEPELPVSKWELRPGNKDEIKKIADQIASCM